MKIFIPILLATLFLGLISSLHNFQVEAWWSTGHMLVSRIALLNVNDHVRAVANKHAQYLAQIGPFPDNADATELACLPDDLKTFDLQQMSGWHFVNFPYNPTNMSNIPNEIQDVNVATAIPGFREAIRRTDQNGWTDSFSLAYLLHLYGDIHQPLHCASYFSPEFPRGDEGGNLIVLDWNGEALNLHAFWDSICQQTQYHDPPRPLTADMKQWLQDTAVKFNNTYGPSISLQDVLLTNTTLIAQETFGKAVSVAYDGIVGVGNQTADGKYPSWYQQKCIGTAERQITLGGLRLAQVLNEAFWNASMPTLLVNTGDSDDGELSGPTRAGMFFGGFCFALFLIVLSWLFYMFVWMDGNEKNKNEKNGNSSNSGRNGNNNNASYVSVDGGDSVRRHAEPSSPVFQKQAMTTDFGYHAVQNEA